MVVAEETSLSVGSFAEQKKVVKKPRMAHEELQRLRKIVEMKGLVVSESQLLAAVYTGCDLFFNEGVDSE